MKPNTLNIDETDIRIIECLQEDGRMAATKITEKTPKTNNRLVQYRIDKLVATEIIHPMAIINQRASGLRVGAQLWISTEAGHHADVTDQLAELENLSYVACLIGSYDISATMHAKTNADLYSILTDKIGKIRGISDVVTELTPILLKDDYDWRIPGTAKAGERQNPRKPKFSDQTVTYQLTEQEKQIINLLVRNSRLSANTISNVLDGVSPKIVRSRIENLVKKKVIRFGARLDPSKLGYTVNSAAKVTVSSNQVGEVAQKLAELEPICYVAQSLNRGYIDLGIYATSLDMLYHFLVDDVQQIAGIQETETMIIAQTVKDLRSWTMP